MNWQIPLLAVMCVSLSALGAEKPQKERSDEQIERFLRQIILPKVEFTDVPLTDAIASLGQDAKRLDPERLGVPIRFQVTGLIPSVQTGEAGSALEDTKVSLTAIPNLSLGEALNAVVAGAQLKTRVHDGQVLLVFRWDRGPMVTRNLSIPPDFFPSWEEQDRVFRLDVAQQMKRDIQGFLKLGRVAFDEGAWAKLSKDRKHLHIHNTFNDIESVTAIFQHSRPSRVALLKPGAPKLTADFSPRSHPSNIAQRMMKIILPEVALEDVELKEAVTKIEALGRQFDLLSPKKHRGIPIVVSTPALKTPPGVSDDDTFFGPPIPAVTRITYVAKNVSLLEAVEAVTILARSSFAVHVADELAPSGRLYQIDPRAGTVEIYWNVPARHHFNASYAVPPNGLPILQIPPQPFTISRMFAFYEERQPTRFYNDWGAYVTPYCSHRLYMAATAARQQAVSEMVKSAWDEYYESTRNERRTQVR